ncbi:MAG TPA: DUF72 domain-containing protein [Candidatus Binatus sp.]|nr:DUF72 domain-containing protein [Candidatus Binatus sp.]
MAARARSVRVLVGTSGFSYPAWRGTFYPEDLPAREMLSFYSQALATVEINHTFRRLPTPALLTGWGRQTPPGFRFALKAPQRITHVLRLRDAGAVTADFCRVAAGLGPKLGPLLFQLPPYLRFDAARLAEFLAALPPHIEPAMEFRHESWFNDETYALLRKHRAALCIADADELSTPPVATAPFGYLRLRRERYDDPDLDAWAARVRETTQWKRVYVYFKHEESGRGPALARAFIARIG